MGKTKGGHGQDLSDWVLSYADDSLVLASSFQQLIERLDIVLNRAKSDNIKYNLSKCNMCTNSVDFLGHTICADGTVKPMQKHIMTIKNMKSPENRDQLRRALGALNFLSKYVRYYNAKTRALYRLLRKDVAWVWTNVEEQAFSELKADLVSSSVLKLPGSKNCQ